MSVIRRIFENPPPEQVLKRCKKCKTERDIKDFKKYGTRTRTACLSCMDGTADTVIKEIATILPEDINNMICGYIDIPRCKTCRGHINGMGDNIICPNCQIMLKTVRAGKMWRDTVLYMLFIQDFFKDGIFNNSPTVVKMLKGVNIEKKYTLTKFQNDRKALNILSRRAMRGHIVYIYYDIGKHIKDISAEIRFYNIFGIHNGDYKGEIFQD